MGIIVVHNKKRRNFKIIIRMRVWGGRKNHSRFMRLNLYTKKIIAQYYSFSDQNIFLFPADSKTTSKQLQTISKVTLKTILKGKYILFFKMFPWLYRFFFFSWINPCQRFLGRCCSCARSSKEC